MEASQSIHELFFHGFCVGTTRVYTRIVPHLALVGVCLAGEKFGIYYQQSAVEIVVECSSAFLLKNDSGEDLTMSVAQLRIMSGAGLPKPVKQVALSLQH